MTQLSMRKVTLRLSDGTCFHGTSFGYEQPVAGEVVFNTAMMGYPESLTDPSYAGQLMALTYPLVGNYGVPAFSMEADGLATFMESDRIYASAIIVSDYSERYSHWNAHESLAEWLKREHIPGITGIDTRALTKCLREHGVMMGQIIFDDEPDNLPEATYEGVNFVDEVSCKEVITYRQEGLENDPNTCDIAVQHIRKFIEAEMPKQESRPLMGICMGNQLLGKAAGATVYKLKYGHRSHNQPVRMVGTERCFITTQNHGYAVDTETLMPGWEPYFVNMNDGSNEGIRHTSKPWFSAQFHPEACAGPVDTEFLFDDFIALLK